MIQWIVSVFHAFKSQLALQALDDKGRVLPAYVKLYQNNMLVHLRAQQASLAAVTVDFDQIQWASTRGPIDA